MASGRRDLISGAFLLVFSIGLYLMIPGQVETLEGETLTPASLPTIITLIIGILSLVLISHGIRAKPGAADAAPGTGIAAHGFVIAAIGTTLAYTGLIPWLGYMAATGLALLALAILYRNRNWWQILAMMVVAPPAILLFFRTTMFVLLPEGSLFE